MLLKLNKNRVLTSCVGQPLLLIPGMGLVGPGAGAPLLVHQPLQVGQRVVARAGQGWGARPLAQRLGPHGRVGRGRVVRGRQVQGGGPFRPLLCNGLAHLRAEEVTWWQNGLLLVTLSFRCWGYTVPGFAVCWPCCLRRPAGQKSHCLYSQKILISRRWNFELLFHSILFNVFFVG